MGNAASIARELRADLSRTIGSAMIRGRIAVTDATPVDTKNAANNWILSCGTPFMGVDGSREHPSDAMQKEGDARIERYDIGRDGKIFLRNNTLYLQFLDRGWSDQAEPGFVAAAFNSAADGVAHGRRGAARKLLRNMARAAYHKTY